ncbi:uncharacterized protein Dana_GF15804 [Drosophila ananassae]|uniref:Lipase n=1 Tax=Drosophila ananassae TaxID=7217 RepID=B3MJK5_DROAN|nr:lipase 1 [Drosophila ananassae]EDV32373.2 uncharacterized protein Dana_GF15804 [Drosophila ananassae]
MLGTKNMILFCEILLSFYLNFNFVSCALIQYNELILEDANLLVPDLIRKYDYPVEVHKIHTKDGFILTSHRIPKSGGQPVLIVHGLLDSSAGFVILGPNKSLAFLLSDLGYDIWLLNTRGNQYSRKHKRFHRYQPEFWNFSFHELGIYDLPAAIDYILSRSKGFEQLHYIGHSQGTTSFFVMGSERPIYMKKIKLMQALAPVTTWYNNGNPIARTFAKYIRPLSSLAKSFGIYELPPENEVWRRLYYNLCSFAFPNTCTYILFELFGVNYQQFNSSLIPLFLGHAAAGSSVKSLLHYLQLVYNEGFLKYDYYEENPRIYGRDSPPQYDLANVDCKIALHYGKNDKLTAAIDVQNLRKTLPNVILDNLISNERFNHIDFIWGNDVKTMLYDDVMEIMKKVENGEV